MGISDSEVALIESLISPIVGTSVDEARLSDLGGSLISVTLGGGLIWVHMASWRIESDSEFLTACEDHRDYIRGMVAKLDGRRLSGVSLSPFLDVTFDFDGLRLMLFNASSRATGVESWSIQLPSGQALFVTSGQTWSLR
ncbi:hypothetical protein [Micromonospora sp. A200]|uniref:hypothetical protein n=1 Tax=Micromonospora sp. A200 TaxID=2940568 RepID=UPI0024757BF2|nr:hypothetical protein [Micromonospora sp. A200]